MIYRPFVGSADKGVVAPGEFLLLAAIIPIARVGQARRRHGPWVETHRVAEYFRRAPILLA